MIPEWNVSRIPLIPINIPQSLEMARDLLDSDFKLFCQVNGITHEMGDAKASDQYGTPYTVISIGGIKGEGEAIPFVFPQGAYPRGIDMFLQSLAQWLGPRRHLVFRRLPEIGQDPGTDYWKITARLSAYTNEITFKEPVDAIYSTERKT